MEGRNLRRVQGHGNPVIRDVLHVRHRMADRAGDPLAGEAFLPLHDFLVEHPGLLGVELGLGGVAVEAELRGLAARVVGVDPVHGLERGAEGPGMVGLFPLLVDLPMAGLARLRGNEPGRRRFFGLQPPGPGAEGQEQAQKHGEAHGPGGTALPAPARILRYSDHHRCLLLSRGRTTSMEKMTKPYIKTARARPFHSWIRSA